MDIVWNTNNVGNALWVMLLGMVGIFVVMGIILVGVVLLGKFTKSKDKEDEHDGK